MLTVDGVGELHKADRGWMTTDRSKEAVIEELLVQCVDFFHIPSTVSPSSYELFCLYVRLVDCGEEPIPALETRVRCDSIEIGLKCFVKHCWVVRIIQELPSILSSCKDEEHSQFITKLLVESDGLNPFVV